ncbi:MAG: nucleotidyltransferase domain-containing protein [bacterium]|nr:nucleotidyltransferase domain-containing protein [bacterium]
MHPAIAEKQDELTELFRQYDVVRPEVFGSAARGTDFCPDTSDADFLVEFNRNGELRALEQFFGLAEALREVLGRPVDLVENHMFRNPYLRDSINESRELVYAA